jgi:glycosyltransferase involved in cell wall biosynthesis
MNKKIKATKGIVSIITIVRNGVDQIEETIKSVISQKDVNLQYIIIDGNSTDGTLGIIEKYKGHINIVISEPDKGIYDAINKGIKHATGDLIGLIHCGDKYNDGILSVCYQKFVQTKKDIIYGDISILEQTEKNEILRNKSANHLLLKKKMSIFHPSTFISRECYSRIGEYNQNYKIAADYDFLLRCYTAGVSFHYVPISLATFRSGGVSGNTNKLIKELFIIWKNNIDLFYAVRNVTFRLFYYYYYYLRKKTVVLIIGENNYSRLKIKKYKQNG